MGVGVIVDEDMTVRERVSVTLILTLVLILNLTHTHILKHPPLKNTITRRRIKFCIQDNQLDSQHSFTSEYQQEILESTANFSYVEKTYD